MLYKMVKSQNFHKPNNLKPNNLDDIIRTITNKWEGFLFVPHSSQALN